MVGLSEEDREPAAHPCPNRPHLSRLLNVGTRIRRREQQTLERARCGRTSAVDTAAVIDLENDDD